MWGYPCRAPGDAVSVSTWIITISNPGTCALQFIGATFLSNFQAATTSRIAPRTAGSFAIAPAPPGHWWGIGKHALATASCSDRVLRSAPAENYGHDQ